MIERYESMEHCETCGYDYLVNEEIASYKCPVCHPDKRRKEEKKPLDKALEKLDKTPKSN